jgi:SAM-dependent methyltransferase
VANAGWIEVYFLIIRYNTFYRLPFQATCFLPSVLNGKRIHHRAIKLFVIMNDINNQVNYWNSVAHIKHFTHPLNEFLVSKYFKESSYILDYGCGYGRITGMLFNSGYKRIIGVDTSLELIKRGKQLNPGLELLAIDNPLSMAVENNCFDIVILFAVLTCIPSNDGQKELISLLQSKLKPGAILYISDYYLQQETNEVSRYENLNGDPLNYGVFTLAEGATFRHHTREWIRELLQDMEILEEVPTEVKTMNGHSAMAFQIIARKR